MQRSLVPVLTLVLMAAAIPAGTAPAAADGFVSVSTAVEPSQPVPEEEFTIQTTISSSSDTTTDYRLVEAEVRRGSGPDADLVSEERYRVGIDPGTRTTVDVGATLNESGTHEVFVRLIFRDGTGNRQVLVQPVTVQVIEGHPQTDVSTDAALPGDDQTMTVGVSNGLEAAVNNVELTVDSDTVEIRNPRRVVATIGTGASMSFDFRTTPAAETTQPVNVTVRYTYEGDRRETTYELTPDFTPTSDVEHPQVAVDAESGEPGESRTVSVNLSNGLEQTVRNVELRLAGDRIDVSDTRRVSAAVSGGATETFEFTVTPEAETSLPVRIELAYTTDGERRGVDYELQTDFSSDVEPTEHPQLQLDVQEAVPGATRSVNVTVANGLEQGVRQVGVTVSSPAVRFNSNEQVRSTLQAGGTTQLQFSAVAEEAGNYPVNVTLVYRDDGVQQRVTRTFQADFSAPSNPGQITLTGVEAVARGDTVELSATASNVGSESVDSVVVTIPDSADVTGTDYFVGGVDASDFSSFTVSTTAGENVSTLPVEVTYVVDNVEKTLTAEVPVQRQTIQRPSRSSSSGGGVPLIPIAAVGVLVIVLAVAYRVRG